MEIVVRGSYLARSGNTLLLQQVTKDQKGQSREDLLQLFCPDGVRLADLGQGELVEATCFLGQKKRDDGQGYRAYFTVVKSVEAI